MKNYNSHINLLSLPIVAALRGIAITLQYYRLTGLSKAIASLQLGLIGLNKTTALLQPELKGLNEATTSLQVGLTGSGKANTSLLLEFTGLSKAAALLQHWFTSLRKAITLSRLLSVDCSAKAQSRTCGNSTAVFLPSVSRAFGVNRVQSLFLNINFITTWKSGII